CYGKALIQLPHLFLLPRTFVSLQLSNVCSTDKLNGIKYCPVKTNHQGALCPPLQRRISAKHCTRRSTVLPTICAAKSMAGISRPTCWALFSTAICATTLSTSSTPSNGTSGTTNLTTPN